MKFPTTTVLTILSSLLITPCVALPAPDPFPEADASPFDANIPPELAAVALRDLDPRQAASARINNAALTFSGDGCPNAASFSFSVNTQGSGITITFTNFTVVVPAPSSTTQKRCNLGIPMTFPAACLAVSTTASYTLSGRFGTNVVAGMDSTYTMSAPGRIVGDDNPPRRFFPEQFSNGATVTVSEQVGINFNTPSLVNNARFGLGILDIMTAGAGAAPGGTFQVRSVTWTLGSQTRC